MREGGQRTQPLGIRREARLSPSQTCSIPSSSVSRARCGNCFAAVPRHRCSIGFSSGLSHCGAYPQLRSGLSRARPCACEREQSPLARRGKPSRIFRAHSSGPLPAVHAPLAGNRRSVAQYLCGHRARRLMRTYHAVSQGRTWTRSEQPDAAHTAGTLIEASHLAAPPAETQADGAAERSRPAHVCSVRHLARAATVVVGAHIPQSRGTSCLCTRPQGCEVLTRGSKRRPPPRSPPTTR